MKTVCVYHSIDLDGWMSAAIVKHWFSLNYPNENISEKHLIKKYKNCIYKIK